MGTLRGLVPSGIRQNTIRYEGIAGPDKSDLCERGASKHGSSELPKFGSVEITSEI